MLVTGCATVSQRFYREALDLYHKGDIEKAYNSIKEAYNKSPQDQGIQEAFEKIKKALIQQYIDRANKVQYDLPEKRAILQKALEFDGQRKDISSLLLAVEQEIKLVNYRVVEALNKQDPLECFKSYLKLRDYEPYFNNIQTLKDKISSSKGILLNKIDDLVADGREDQAIALSFSLENRFQNIIEFKKKGAELFTRKASVLVSLGKQYANLENDDRVSTAIVYFLLAWNYDKNLPGLRDIITNKLIAIKERAIPRLIIEFSGSFSDQQKEKIISSLKTFQQRGQIRDLVEIHSSFKPINNDLFIILTLNDLSIEVKPTEVVKYSKYLAGYQSVPNPQYDSLVAQYNYAVLQFQQTSNQFAYDPNNWGLAFAKGLWQGKVNQLASALAATPSYTQQPVYQDYQYLYADFNYELNFKLKYQLVDSISQITLKEGLFEKNDYQKRTAISGAHPQDKQGIIDRTVSSGESNLMLEDFTEKNIEALSQFIIYDLVGKKNLFEAELARRENNLSEAVDRIFTYKLLNWLVSSRFAGQQITDNEIDSLVSDFNIVSAKEILDTYWEFQLEKPDLSIKNVFVKSFCHANFLTKELADYGEVFEKFDPENFKYKKSDPKFDSAKAIKRLSGRVGEKTERRNPPAQSTNVIERCLASVVVVQTLIGTGSGFIIDPQGYIITNYHVVSNQDNITIILNDGRRLFADLLSLIKFKDLALLKINAENLSAIKLGRMSDVRVGDAVYALGAPGGWAEKQILDQTVTRGIVSSIRMLEAPYNPTEKIQFIQTDAAINPGNSGGPLINERGEVIGVNSQKMVKIEVEGLNFAISIDEVKKSFAEYLK